ncbi:uncharacterized protein LOC128890583 [Hylaeus anthracinus]|uniref:uncharacterized protein LOC128875060 n=1 Tax=Hylaeus volcanicus TaxID=313075 RepID=UPI0023B806C3|nr:uncharacterized protein LOC128875060 [Hylaeus volcanicus]XP_054005205.1 uncharacterized protein LOC128890583 [Hylaeus anthracinus]
MTVVEDTSVVCDRQMTMEAILTRDQRTTSHRVLDHRVSQNSVTAMTATTITTSTNRCNGLVANSRYAGVIAPGVNKDDQPQRHLRCDSYFVPAFYYDRGIRSKHNAPITATTCLRLGSLLVTLLVISVHGAPTMTLESRRLSSPPKWVNPCGLAAEDFTGDLDVVQLSDSQLLHQVVVQARTALMHAELFREDYAKRIFNIDYADLHSTFKDHHYDWLPGPREIPKELGGQLEQEYLDTLELDTALIDAYEYMQKYAVGLEQIVWDQEDLQLEFRKQFKDTEYRLRTVLCELQVALVERQLSSRPDVTRDIMRSEFRAMSSSATFRNLRDWLIFRDYMNGLEYVVQVFEHLRRGLQS